MPFLRASRALALPLIASAGAGALLLLSLVRAAAWLSILALLAAALFVAGHRSPADLPFTPLDLDRTIGAMTHAKLIGLDGEPGRCRALLARAGIAIRALPARRASPACAVDDGVAWARGGARTIAYAPAAPVLACPLAAALALWERDVLQPAAAAMLGSRVVGIDHYGSQACRRIAGRGTGDWSEHARARAIDVAGFRLADGRRITVARDWKAAGPGGAFLHRVRAGGCTLFSTTLSPDYNAAHRDHLHLDMSARYADFCR